MNCKKFPVKRQQQIVLGSMLSLSAKGFPFTSNDSSQGNYNVLGKIVEFLKTNKEVRTTPSI